VKRNAINLAVSPERDATLPAHPENHKPMRAAEKLSSVLLAEFSTEGHLILVTIDSLSGAD
jgi:hypothetical protein